MHSGLFPTLKKRSSVIFLCILLLGIIPRIILLGSVPGGVNQDEAYATYEAYSLLKTGMDSRGYVNPVYFVSWGSGMNVLLSYILIPFVHLIGLNIFAARIPMVIIACLTMPALYGCMRRMFNERIALLSMFLLAISPWHIGMSRWALEANLVPAFLIFSLYFFLRTLDNPGFAPLCGLFYGLSLYCYAIMWIVVPLTLFMSLSYGIWTHRFKKACIAHYAVGILILAVLALPLVLFVLINKDLLPEIRTAYFSIPHLVTGRMDEVSLSNILDNIHNTLYIFFHQADRDLINASPKYGFYHHISYLFFPFGLYVCIKHLREQKDSPYILFQFLASVPIGILVNIMVQRINGIYIPIIAITAVGIDFLVTLFKKHRRQVFAVIIALYIGLFCRFEYHYFTDYSKSLDIIFLKGLEDGISRARELAGDDPIYVSWRIHFSRILFYDQTDPALFQTTDEWSCLGGDGKYQSALRFDCWTYKDEDITDNTICLMDIPTSYDEPFRNMDREEYGWVAVMVPKQQSD